MSFDEHHGTTFFFGLSKAHRFHEQAQAWIKQFFVRKCLLVWVKLMMLGAQPGVQTQRQPVRAQYPRLHQPVCAHDSFGSSVLLAFGGCRPIAAAPWGSEAAAVTSLHC